MLCQKCGKREANFHYTQVVNNVKTEVNLCSECANNLGLTKKLEDEFNMSSMFDRFFSSSPFDRLFSGFGNMIEMPRMFKIDGEKLYKNEFEHEVDKMFSSFGDEKAKEQDKVKNDNPKDTKDNLKMQLNKAIKEERYEDAAKLRDEIKKIKE